MNSGFTNLLGGVTGARLKRAVRLGLKSLWLHRLRSLLTMLGIVFGVCSVIAMLAIGEGASHEAQEQIKNLGSQNIIHSQHQTAGGTKSFGPGQPKLRPAIRHHVHRRKTHSRHHPRRHHRHARPQHSRIRLEHQSPGGL
jgi:ABC-type lipoprotein release transport system permease subunit